MHVKELDNAHKWPLPQSLENFAQPPHSQSENPDVARADPTSGRRRAGTSSHDETRNPAPSASDNLARVELPQRLNTGPRIERALWLEECEELHLSPGADVWGSGIDVYGLPARRVG